MGTAIDAMTISAMKMAKTLHPFAAVFAPCPISSEEASKVGVVNEWLSTKTLTCGAAGAAGGVKTDLQNVHVRMPSRPGAGSWAPQFGHSLPTTSLALSVIVLL